MGHGRVYVAGSPYRESPACTSRSYVDTFADAEALQRLCDSQAADAEFDQMCARCMEALQLACTEALSAPEFRVEPFDWSPDPKLEPFGSTVQGTALLHSDLDVRLSFVQFEVRAAERQRFYLRGISSSIAEKRSAGGAFEVVRFLEASTIPLLRLRFEGRLDVDISMGDTFEGGADVDRTVREFLDRTTSPGPRQFVRLVKAFAKAHDLVDAYAGLLNSLSWVFLAISFLQQERYLPPLCRKEAHRQDLWVPCVTPGMFVRFFLFLERWREQPVRIDIIKGVCRYRSYTSYYGGRAHPLVIDNPKDVNRNVSQRLSFQGWERTVEACIKAREELQKNLCSEELPVQPCVERLFLPPATRPSPTAAAETADVVAEDDGPAPAKRLRLTETTEATDAVAPTPEGGSQMKLTRAE